MYAIWALQDAETSKTCPRGIAYGKPRLVIVGNNNFKIDTFTGNAIGAHRTNVQPESYKEESNNGSTTAQNVTKKEVSKELNVKCKELTNVQQYVCPRGAGTEPPVRETVAQSKAG